MIYEDVITYEDGEETQIITEEVKTTNDEGNEVINIVEREVTVKVEVPVITRVAKTEFDLSAAIKYRENERSKLYDIADTEIAKHRDYTDTANDPNGEHATALKAWQMYKITVRATKNISGYPADVNYPARPF